MQAAASSTASSGSSGRIQVRPIVISKTCNTVLLNAIISNKLSSLASCTQPAEANQFLHFHDSGLFVGQFGTLSQFGSMGLNPKIPGDRGGEFESFQYALPGEAGNSFGPSR
jgi:hypothetical protein